MIESIFEFPELVPALLAIASLAVDRSLSVRSATRIGAGAAAVACALTVGGWVLGPPPESHGGHFTIDVLSRVLLPYVTFAFLCILVASPRRDRDPASLARLLLAEALVAALFSTRSPGLIAAFWALSPVPVWAALRTRSRPVAKVFAIYAGTSAALLAAGVALGSGGDDPSAAGVVLVALAILMHKGVMPFHSWVPVLFEKGAMWTALAYMLPQAGAYAVMRLLVPAAGALGRGPLWAIATAALATALYGAVVGVGQREAMRALGFVVMSQFALVLVGLDTVTSVGLLGGLTMWLSSGLALTGLGLALRALEVRRGTLRLDILSGGHDRMPLLAAAFLILGLASVGFPGTLGFVAEDLLVRGAIGTYPHVGIGIVLATALNGITILRAYLALFCGARETSSVAVGLKPRESLVLTALVLLLLFTGIIPGPVVASRREAVRAALQGAKLPPPGPGHH
ncbi:MAG: hypothetical protein HYY25_04465 [Candidatus Wallbacteria bacterium]|nr:hypothetical protein [Candidatus Wallbacteria bacterium]